MSNKPVQVSDGVTKVITKEGNGRRPERGNTITVHCTGSLADPRKKFWRCVSIVIPSCMYLMVSLI